MTQQHNKFLNADFFIDKWSENADKIRVYDSKKNYFGYYEPDTIIRSAERLGIAEQEYLDKITSILSNAEDIETFLVYMGMFNYKIACKNDLTPIIDEYADDELKKLSYEQAIEWLESCEYINEIGNYFVMEL